MFDDAWSEWIYMWDESRATWFYTNNPSPTWFKCCPREQQTLRPLAAWNVPDNELEPKLVH